MRTQQRQQRSFHRVFAHKQSWTQTMFHIRLQSLSDFWLVLGVPVVQGVCVDPRQLEIEVRKILSACLPEILTPRTPGVSLGTKFSSPKFFSHHPITLLFYASCGLLDHKMPKFKKNGHFGHICAINKEMTPNNQFFMNFALFRPINPQNA